MVWVLTLLACARQVAWEVQPRPAVDLPSMEVSVVALDRACKRAADELAVVLGARPGVRVAAGAGVQLGLARCDEGATTSVEVDFRYSSSPTSVGPLEQKTFRRLSWATADLIIRSEGTAGAPAPVRVERTDRGTSGQDGSLDIPAAMEGRDSLRRELAHTLADQVAPLPETIRRMVYRDPEAGTARQLHNQAVEAERAGDLQRALDLALQAYAANPTPAGMVLVQGLRAHAESVGYALRE